MNNKNPCFFHLGQYPKLLLCSRQWCLEKCCHSYNCYMVHSSVSKDLSLALVPFSSLQTLHLSALLCYKTLIYGALYDNGLIIAEAKQLNTFPVHKILYTNNEDRG